MQQLVDAAGNAAWAQAAEGILPQPAFPAGLWTGAEWQAAIR